MHQRHRASPSAHTSARRSRGSRDDPRRAAWPTVAGTAGPRTGDGVVVPLHHLRRSRGCANGSRRPAERTPRAAARASGEEYLLERGLYRRKSTGEIADLRITDALVPGALVPRHPARAGLLPRSPPERDQRWPRPSSSSAAKADATAVPLREHPRGRRPCSTWSRGRGVPEPVGHPARAARAAVVGRRLTLRHSGRRHPTVERRMPRSARDRGIRSAVHGTTRGRPPRRGARRRAPARGRP